MRLSEAQSLKIQVLRGLAIAAVVFIHNTPLGIMQVWCRPFMNFAVGLFLFLSGMLSSADRWKPRKRILKVLIPYAIWTLIYVAISHLRDPGAIPLAFLKNLLTANAATMLYYIFVYIQFTLLIPLIDKLARSKAKYLAFAISPIEIIMFRLLPILLGVEFGFIFGRIVVLSCLGWFTYFYLGYLMGNGLLEVKISTKTLVIALVCCVALQMAEGYWYLSMGVENCGTQMKLSSLLTGSVFCLLAFRYIGAENAPAPAFLRLLGDCSFGIFFCHIAVMTVLLRIPFYAEYAVFPLNAIVALLLSLGFVLLGKKVLGRFGKYLAF